MTGVPIVTSVTIVCNGCEIHVRYTCWVHTLYYDSWLRTGLMDQISAVLVHITVIRKFLTFTDMHNHTILCVYLFHWIFSLNYYYIIIIIINNYAVVRLGVFQWYKISSSYDLVGLYHHREVKSKHGYVSSLHSESIALEQLPFSCHY